MITFFIELFYYFDILLCCIIFGPIKDTTCYFFNDTQTLVLIASNITLILYFIITIYYWNCKVFLHDVCICCTVFNFNLISNSLY